MEFIVDNGTNGTLDLPAIKLSLKKGAHDVDLCKLTGKTVKELLSEPQVQHAIQKAWLFVKEKKNGKKIAFKKLERFDLSEMMDRVDKYLASGTKKGVEKLEAAAKPTGLIAELGPKREKVIVDADTEVAGVPTTAVSYKDIAGMKYGDMMKKVSELSLDVEDNKKATLIDALCAFYELEQPTPVEEETESVDTTDPVADLVDVVDNETDVETDTETEETIEDEEESDEK